MARELDTNFSISWAKLEDFRKNVYGSLVITVKEEDKLRVTEFLDKKGVTWEVIEKAVADEK